MNDFVIFKHISRSFGKNTVLRNLNFTLPRHGLVALLGPSGSGKSTILNILSGLDVGYKGRCLIGNACLKDMGQNERDSFRLSRIGYVFQDYSLLELENVLDNVMFPLKAVAKGNTKSLKRRAMDLLRFVGLENKARQRVNTLSGGEKQRVCLARALANEPGLVLADEPTGALDEKNAKIVMNVLKKASKRQLVVLVSHDAELAKQYADQVMYLKDGQIVGEKNESAIEEEGRLVVTHVKEKKRTNSLDMFFLLRHAFHLMQAKKGRTMLTISLIVMGILGLGLSIYVSDSIGQELSSSLGKMVSQNDIVMSPLKRVEQPIGRTYGGDDVVAKRIVADHPSYQADYGIGYLANFEEIFTDSNSFTLSKENREVTVTSFSARSLAEYVWLDEGAVHYPSTPKTMETDQIVLGLPYADMFKICFDFGILRNYESLGSFLSRFYVKGTFYFSHAEWGYEDTQVFHVVAVRESPTPLIYHSDHQWAEKIMEGQMRFPSSYTMDGPDIKPWTLQKIAYISANNLPALLDQLRREKYYDDYVFCPANRSHHKALCPIGEKCNLARAYIYHCDKTSVPYAFLEDVMMRHKGIIARRILTPGSYVAFSGLMVGTPQKCFVGPDEESLSQVIDSYSDISVESRNEDFLLPENVLDAGFLKASTEGIVISNDLRNLESGREAINSLECVVSSSLWERFGKKNSLYIAGAVSEEDNGKMVRRDFRLGKMEIVGVKQESRNILYVNGDWTIDYFRDELGMSPFLLEPSGAIFTCESSGAASYLLDVLAKEYPNYRFSNPGAEIYSSIEESMNYIKLALSAFSCISLLISSLLYFLTMIVSIRENEGETRLLTVLGISRGDIVKAHASRTMLISLASLGLSSLGLFIAEFVIHSYISDSFSASSRFVFATKPIFAMIAFSLLSFLLSVVFLAFHSYFQPRYKEKI